MVAILYGICSVLFKLVQLPMNHHLICLAAVYWRRTVKKSIALKYSFDILVFYLSISMYATLYF